MLNFGIKYLKDIFILNFLIIRIYTILVLSSTIILKLTFSGFAYRIFIYSTIS